jgi:hypothetical protein
MVLLRWSVGAVGAGSVPGGAVGGARFFRFFFFFFFNMRK